MLLFAFPGTGLDGERLAFSVCVGVYEPYGYQILVGNTPSVCDAERVLVYWFDRSPDVDDLYSTREETFEILRKTTLYHHVS